MVQEFNVGAITATIEVDGDDLRISLGQAQRQISAFRSTVRTGFRALTAPFRFLTGLVRRLVRVLFSLKSAVAGAIAAFGSFRFAQLAADVSNAEQAFQALTASVGVDATFALERLREAARGTADDLSLLQNANQAILLGVANTVEEFELLIEAGRRLGRATGRTAAQGFEDLATGIGRQSRLILDNLGLIVRVEEANERFARSLNKTAAELSDNERQAAFAAAAFAAIEEKLLDLGPDVDTFADAFLRLQVAFRNFATNVARRVTPSLTRFVRTLVSLTDGTGAAERLAQIVSRILNRLSDVVEVVGPRLINLFSILVNLAAQLFTILELSFRLGFQRIIEVFDDPQQLIGAFVTAFSGIAQIAFETGVFAARRFREGITEGLRRLLGRGGETQLLADVVGKEFEEGIGNAIETLGEGLRGIFGGEREGTQQLAEELRQALSGIVDTIRGSDVERGVDNLSEVSRLISEIADRASTFARTTFFDRAFAGLSEFSVEDLAANTEVLGRALQLVNDFTIALQRGQLGDRAQELETAADALREKLRAAQSVVDDAIQKEQQLRLEARKTTEELQNNVRELRSELRIAQELQSLAIPDRSGDSSALAATAEELEDRRAILQVIESTRDQIEELMKLGRVEEAEEIRALTEQQAEILTEILRTNRSIEDSQEAQEDALQRSQRLEKERLALRERLEDRIRRIREDIEDEAVELRFTTDEFDRKIRVIRNDLERLRIEIVDAEINERAKRRLINQLQEAEREAIKNVNQERRTAFTEASGAFAQDIGLGLLDAFRAGENGIGALADVFSRALERNLSALLDRIGQQIGNLFSGLFGQGGLGAALGNILGVGAAIGFAAIQRNQASGSTVSEIPTEEVATSTQQVRGVVAGPQNVAINEVGAQIREAFRGTETLLTDIRNLLAANQFIGGTAGAATP